MKLRNKKTGHIIECSIICSDENLSPRLIESNEGRPITFAELNEEWEDYEEPKEYYFIRDDGSGVGYSPIGNSTVAKRREAIGNYFETKEEAEKAVEKLKAWKRLKDKGFRFNKWTIPEKPKTPHIKLIIEAEMDVPDSSYDLDLIFGGRE